MKYYIYTLEKENKIFYVGKTNNLKQRLAHHKITYGDNIKIQLLSEVIDNWENEEKYWIEQLKYWGFDLKNKNKGGGGETFKSNETRKLISLNQPKTKYRNPKTNIKIGLNQPKTKKPCSEVRKKKISEANKGKKYNLNKTYNCKSYKKVLQYDLENNFIKKWKSVKEILHSLNKKETNMMIYRCLRGDLDSAYGFKFKYEK
jgi:hypothetical protein